MAYGLPTLHPFLVCMTFMRLLEGAIVRDKFYAIPDNRHLTYHSHTILWFEIIPVLFKDMTS